ncbi:MAG: phospholipase [Clostridiales bacterium]|nr:phospholipase [Clostridiales bacterium]
MLEISKFEDLQYVIRYPKNYKDGDKCPVLFFFHGSGSVGKDIELVTGNSFFSVTENIEDFPFVCVAPQCYRETWFELMQTLERFVDYIAYMPFCDKQRIYAMGTSLGGFATWQMGIAHHDYFAAIVPICGAGMYCMAGNLVNIGVWAFHGECDDAIFASESINMVNAIKAAGGNDAKLTIFEGKGHGIWNEVYSNPEVYSWLLQHKNAGEFYTCPKWR